MILHCVCSSRGSLLGSYPGELETTEPSRGSRPLLSDRFEDPVPKMRRMDDNRPAMMMQPSDYDRRPHYMEEAQEHFRLDYRAQPVMEQMPEEIHDQHRKVVSIFDINDRLRREDVEYRAPRGVRESRMDMEQFGSHHDEAEEMLAMQLGRPLMRGSAEQRRGGSVESRASQRDQPMPYDHRMQDDRRMPPKNPPVPSLLDTTMDRGCLLYTSDAADE